MELNQEAIIAKIRKLLALGQSPNQNEAALAMATANRLMQDYNLHVANTESTDATMTAKRGKQKHNKSAMYKWQVELMKAVSSVNFCMTWVGEAWKEDPRGSILEPGTNSHKFGRWVKTHILVGREENVVAATTLYDYLTDTMDRILPFQGTEKRGKDAAVWLGACSERLIERLKEWRRERQESEVGIVLKDAYEKEEAYNTDVANGCPIGTTWSKILKRRAEREAYQKEQEQWRKDVKAKEEELVAGGMDRETAFCVARGYGIPSKTAVVPSVVPETHNQRMAREAQERKEEARYEKNREKRSQEQEREWRKNRERRDNPVYQSGLKAAENINLDQQVTGRERERVA